MSTHELESTIRELRQLQSLIAEAEAEAEALRDALMAHMGEREELRAGEYRVSWKPIKAARIDTAALKKALPEVAERFTRETTTRRFVVM